MCFGYIICYVSSMSAFRGIADRNDEIGKFWVLFLHRLYRVDFGGIPAPFGGHSGAILEQMSDKKGPTWARKPPESGPKALLERSQI